MKLPSCKSIRNWTSSIDGEPGFFKEVFTALKNLKPDDKHCSLIFDAMSIKNKYYGMKNYRNLWETVIMETK